MLQVCTYLQDECDAQRDAFEHVNKALLNQNAQLALQKDGHVRRIFALEIKIQELETALCSLGRDHTENRREGAENTLRDRLGLVNLLQFPSFSLSHTTRQAIKIIPGGRKTGGSLSGSRSKKGTGEQEMQKV